MDGESTSPLDDGLEVVLVEGDAAAGPAEREGRPDDDRVAEGFAIARALETARHAGLQDVDAAPHRLIEGKKVLAGLDGLDGGSERFDAVPCEESILVERDREVEGRMSADGRKQRVRLLLRDDRGDRVAVERLDVGRVRELGIRHDRRRVRVDEDDPVALALQGAAGLGPGVVELAGLADHDRAGSQHENRLDVGPFRHRERSLRDAGRPRWHAPTTRDRVSRQGKSKRKKEISANE